MLSLVRHAQACLRFYKITNQQLSLGRVELFYLFVVCSYTSVEATVLSCCFSWVWSSMPKVLSTNHQYFWKGLSDLVDFLQAVIYVLLDIHCSYKNMLFWVGNVRHSFSANQIFKCFKPKKLKHDMSYQVDFLLPLKLEQICYFGLWPQNTIGQSVCRTFYFWLIWFIKRNTGSPLLHCTCFCQALVGPISNLFSYCYNAKNDTCCSYDVNCVLHNPANIYLFKFNNRHTRWRSENMRSYQ